MSFEIADLRNDPAFMAPSNRIHRADSAPTPSVQTPLGDRVVKSLQERVTVLPFHPRMDTFGIPTRR